MRSPTRDYPAPPARDAHGQVLGVDGVPPEDRIRETPTVGPDGASAAEQPDRGETGPHAHEPPDPCKQIGLKDADGHSKCKDDE